MWLVCFRPPARLLPRRGQRGAVLAKYNCCLLCKRDHAQLGRGFLGVQNDRTRTLRPDARARATTGLDTPSSGRASVPSRIRPESTVREITKPVSLALSSSTPSDARDRARSWVSAMRAGSGRERPEPDRARVAKYTERRAERRARVLPLDVLRCAHLLARAVRSMRRARPLRLSSGRFRLVCSGTPCTRGRYHAARDFSRFVFRRR